MRTENGRKAKFRKEREAELVQPSKYHRWDHEGHLSKSGGGE